MRRRLAKLCTCLAVTIGSAAIVRAAEEWPEVRQVVSTEQERLLEAIPADQRAAYETYARSLVTSLGTSREALLGIAASFRLDRESGAWKFRPVDEAAITQASQLLDECILIAERFLGACPVPPEARHESLRTEMKRTADARSTGQNPLWPAFRRPLAEVETQRVREACLAWIDHVASASDLFAARFARSDAEHEAAWRDFVSEFARSVLLAQIDQIEERRIRDTAWRIESEIAGADLGPRPSVNVANLVVEALGGFVQINGGPHCMPSDRVQQCISIIDEVYTVDPRFRLVNEEVAADIRGAIEELRCLLVTGDDETVNRVTFGLRWRIVNAAQSVYAPLPSEERERRADQAAQILDAIRGISREFRRHPSPVAGLDQAVDAAVKALVQVTERQLGDSTLPTLRAPLDSRKFEDILARHQVRVAEAWAVVRIQFADEIERLQRTGGRVTPDLGPLASDRSMSAIFNDQTRQRMLMTATRSVNSLACALMRDYAYAARLPLTEERSIVFFSDDDPTSVRFGCDSSGIQVGVGTKP